MVDKKTCLGCQRGFEVTPEDRTTYARLDVPDPTLCPACRHQRRCSWRNEDKLYHRKCDLSGKQIVSIYSPDKPYPVYAQEEYWSDRWNALDYGQELDVKIPFFPQFERLLKRVPRLAIVNKQSENSDFCNFSFANKNCYLTFGSHSEEDSYYGHYSTKNKNCLDYLWLYQSELCYECLYSKRCYRSVFLDHCDDCTDCFFSVDLKNCKDCIFSSNLRNKQYYILNEPHTKEEYFKKLSSFQFHRFSRFEEARSFFLNQFRERFPFQAVYQTNCENCEGGTHEHSKNLKACFDATNCEDSAYGIQMDNSSHVIDVDQLGYDRCEWCYETIGINGGTNLMCCESSWHNSDLMYCSLTFNSRNCFGSISLNQQQYCILNKQYSKEEYELLVPQIIETMKKYGEWGNFFLVEMSPFGYNESIAFYDAPLTEAEVRQRAWKWHDEDQGNAYQGPDYVIPDDISEVKDEITHQVLRCSESQKPYKIIPQELRLYRELGIPIPRRSPVQRHLDRIHRRSPRQLWNRPCSKCQKTISSSYSPDRPEQVYCEACYLQTVY
jgi:hypothetical protein